MCCGYYTVILKNEIVTLEGDSEFVGVKNVGVEIVAPSCSGGNCGSGIFGTKHQGWKTWEWKSRKRKSVESEGFNKLLLTVLTENRVIIFGYH